MLSHPLLTVGADGRRWQSLIRQQGDIETLRFRLQSEIRKQYLIVPQKNHEDSHVWEFCILPN